MKRFTLVFVLVLLQALSACSNSGGRSAITSNTRTLAAAGDANAQNSIGLSYAAGEPSAQEYAEAARWFRLAAEQDHAQAQYNLGLLYGKGLGVPYDLAAAEKWTRLAAEQGDPLAQYNLGVIYHNGEGVRQDVVQAHMWLNLAAERLPPGEEHDKVVIIRDEIARLMTLSQILDGQRLAREWRPRTQ
jgi:TPR repeat protein